MTTAAVESHWCSLEWMPLESYWYVPTVKLHWHISSLNHVQESLYKNQL